MARVREIKTYISNAVQSPLKRGQIMYVLSHVELVVSLVFCNFFGETKCSWLGVVNTRSCVVIVLSLPDISHPSERFLHFGKLLSLLKRFVEVQSFPLKD